MLLVSVIVAFSNSIDQEPLVQALTTLQRSVRGRAAWPHSIFAAVFRASGGVSRKQVSFGISLGFGIVAGVRLMLMRLNSGGFCHAQESQPDQHGRLWSLPFLFGSATHSRVKPCARPPSTVLQTQRWEQGLADIQPPGAFRFADSRCSKAWWNAPFSRSSNSGALRKSSIPHSIIIRTVPAQANSAAAVPRPGPKPWL